MSEADSAPIAWPASTRRPGHVTLNKDTVCAQARPTAAVRRRYLEQVTRTRWTHSLRPDTARLAATADVPLINVFELYLAGPDLHPGVLTFLDRGIPAPAFFELHHGGRVRTAAAYKRPSDAGGGGGRGAWVTGEHFFTAWVSADAPRAPLPVAVDLGVLYDRLLRRVLPLSTRPDEPLRDHAERAGRAAVLKREAAKLAKRVAKEKQFNRRVELNRELAGVRERLNDLQRKD